MVIAFDWQPVYTFPLPTGETSAYYSVIILVNVFVVLWNSQMAPYIFGIDASLTTEVSQEDAIVV